LAQYRRPIHTNPLVDPAPRRRERNRMTVTADVT